MKNQLFKIAIVLLCVFLKFSDTIGQQYTYSFQWGSTGNGTRQFYAPTAVALDASGNVYVADAGNNRISKFNSSGIFITQWGSPGSGNAQFNYPTGIAVDGSGNVYVADQNNNRIQKFTSAGTYTTQWGSAGNTNGLFHSPTGVAVDASGNVYVADAGNDRIQKFNGSGTYSTQWGSIGSGNSQFKYPTGVAVDGSGNVYVADQDNNRIQKFSNTGTYSTQWGSVGSGNDQFYAPTGISVDGSGNVYVMDSGNDRMQKFSNTGSFITTLGSYGSINGLFSYPTGIAVNSSGALYVADQDNSRIQVFSLTCTACGQLSSYGLINSWGSYGTGNGQFTYPHGIAIDGSGNVYVADYVNDNIQVFTSTGTYITKWGTYGTGNGQFYELEGIAMDGSGNVYVVDAGNDRIQKFTSTGTYITQWGTSGTGNGQFSYANGIAVDGSGNIYISDLGNNNIQKFSSTGTFLLQWGSYGTGNGMFELPRGIAADASGNVYVCDGNNERIQKFSSTGTYITQWGSLGTGNGQFGLPTSVAVDGFGNVYVADPDNNRIQKFTSSGTYVTQWSTGTGNWTDSYQWIAVDRFCNVYASDRFIPGIKVFSGFTPTPTIISFTPSSGGICPVVVITGTGLTGATAVSINGTAASSFTVNSSTQITATFPNGISTGPIVVTTSCGQVVSSTDFIVQSCNIHTYAFSRKWMSSPNLVQNDMVIDASGNIYIATSDNYCRKYDNAGNLLAQWGGTGTAGNGYFNNPNGIAVDASGIVYVKDYTLIQRFSISGSGVTWLGQWSIGSDLVSSSIYTHRLVIDKSNYLYTIIRGNGWSYKVRKYSSANGSVALDFANQYTYGNAYTNDCIRPWGIAVDNCYNVFITDATDISDDESQCPWIGVLKYNGLTGAFIKAFGNYGTADGQTARPTGIAVDVSGNIYVCDTEEPYASPPFVNHRIQKFDNDGNFLGKFGSYDGTGTINGEFNFPMSVAVDNSCNVYVNDNTNRVQVFSPSMLRLAAQRNITQDVPKADVKVAVYPNPNAGEFNIFVRGADKFDFTLCNSLGQAILKESVTGENYAISNENLTDGIYVLHVSSSGETYQVKLVVTK